MGKLPRTEERRTTPLFRLSLSGFDAGTQKMRLTDRMKGVAATLMLALLVAVSTAVIVAPEMSFAADRLSPRVTPTPRATPAPVMKPQRVQPMPNTATNPGLNRNDMYNNAAQRSNCQSRCGSSCQTMGCSGLNTSQCLSMQQQCRMNCRSRC
jgi:hypothetical protein